MQHEKLTNLAHKSGFNLIKHSTPLKLYTQLLLDDILLYYPDLKSHFKRHYGHQHRPQQLELW